MTVCVLSEHSEPRGLAALGSGLGQAGTSRARSVMGGRRATSRSLVLTSDAAEAVVGLL